MCMCDLQSRVEECLLRHHIKTFGSTLLFARSIRGAPGSSGERGRGWRSASDLRVGVIRVISIEYIITTYLLFKHTSDFSINVLISLAK